MNRSDINFENLSHALLVCKFQLRVSTPNIHTTFPYCLQKCCVSKLPYFIHFPSYSPQWFNKEDTIFNVNKSTSARSTWHTHDQQTNEPNIHKVLVKKKSIECTGAIVKRFFVCYNIYLAWCLIFLVFK